MIFFRIIIFFIALFLIIAWRILLQPIGFPLFPIGALMVLPLVYFNWRATLVFTLLLTFVWESGTPLPLGAVALPLTVGCLILQLLARHQLRANFATKIFAAILLQSIVTIAVGLKFSPHTIAGAVLQLAQTLWQLLIAGTLSFLWLWASEILAKKGFKINLEGSLKDL